VAPPPLRAGGKVSRDHPVVISKYITGAKEVEMDGIGKASWTMAPASGRAVGA